MINVTPFLTFGLSIIHFKEGFLEQKQSWAGGEFIADQP